MNVSKKRLKILYDEKHYYFTAMTTKETWILNETLGFSPLENLVVSIGSCCAYVYDTVLTNSAVLHKFEKVEMDYGQLGRKKTDPLQWVEIHFYLQMEEKFQDKALRCLTLVQPNCPVVQSLKADISIKEHVHFI